MELRKKLLEDLIRYGKERALSETELAAEVGVGPQVLSNWKARGQVSKDAIEPILERFPFDLPNRPAALPKLWDGSFSIPQLDVSGSMGAGSIPPDHVDVVRNVVVNRKELEKQCSFTSAQNLQIITGYGRSMQPTFQDGDPLLVDTGVSAVTVDAVYVFEIEGELFIKGLQRLPGGRLRVISHNRSENDPWEIDPFQMESLKIRGRVVMAWNARRL